MGLAFPADSNSASTTVTLDNTPTVGNVLYAFMCAFAAQAPGYIDTPTGWVLVGQASSFYSPSPVNYVQVNVWKRVVQAGDGTVWTFPSGGIAGGTAGAFMGTIMLEVANTTHTQLAFSLQKEPATTTDPVPYPLTITPTATPALAVAGGFSTIPVAASGAGNGFQGPKLSTSQLGTVATPAPPIGCWSAPGWISQDANSGYWWTSSVLTNYILGAGCYSDASRVGGAELSITPVQSGNVTYTGECITMVNTVNSMAVNWLLVLS